LRKEAAGIAGWICMGGCSGLQGKCYRAPGAGKIQVISLRVFP
jgi:hypothetical protein